METRVKSLRARAYFRSSLIGSTRGLSSWLSRIYLLNVCEPSIPLPYRSEVKSSIPRERCHATLLPTKCDFYFIPKHFSRAHVPRDRAKNRYGVTRGNGVYQDVSLSPLANCFVSRLIYSRYLSCCRKSCVGCRYEPISTLTVLRARARRRSSTIERMFRGLNVRGNNLAFVIYRSITSSLGDLRLRNHRRM